MLIVGDEYASGTQWWSMLVGVNKIHFVVTRLVIQVSRVTFH